MSRVESPTPAFTQSSLSPWLCKTFQSMCWQRTCARSCPQFTF